MKNHNELLASHRVLSMLEGACEYSENILDHIPSVFVVLNEDNRVIRANHAFCDLVGCNMEGALHKDFSSFFTIENREILRHNFNHVRSAEGTDTSARVRLEMTGLAGEQSTKPFSWHIFQLEHISKAEGRVISVIGDDLSGLYQSEMKLMSIFSSIPLGLMVVDREGIITEVLSDYCHVLLNQRTLIGESLRKIFNKHNSALKIDIDKAFDVLSHCVGEFAANATERELALSAISHLKILEDGAPEKRIKPTFQPIVKDTTVDRYMVTLEDSTASFLAEQEIEKADILGKQAQALYECAIRDPLSGLYTRLFMNDSINRLISASSRGNFHELAVVMFDIDNFKRVNDTYGHSVGDQVIKEFGKIILKCTRDTDVSVRYGGEEFILALPTNAPQDHGGLIVAERIRKTLEETAIDLGDGNVLHVTTSCGVAYCNKDDTLESLIYRSDKYLYAAKHNGKNRVCVETEVLD